MKRSLSCEGGEKEQLNAALISCDVCQGGTEANFFCIQCNKYLCKECDAEFHSRGKFIIHTRRPIIPGFNRVNCSLHIESPLTLFCIDDNGIHSLSLYQIIFNSPLILFYFFLLIYLFLNAYK